MNRITLIKPTFFSLIELLVVIAVLSILASLLMGTIQNISGQAHSLECQNKLRNYINAYNIYLEDYDNVFPAKIRHGALSSAVHFAQVRWEYPDLFPSQDRINCPTFSEQWSSLSNYRGYSGINLKTFNDLKRSPSQIGVIGDGIKSNIVNGYAYFTINDITEAGLVRDRDARRSRIFHQDDFIHIGARVNAAFVDSHVESLDSFEMLQRRDEIWDR